MNEKNLEYLKSSLKYLGFGDKLNEVLESAIRNEMPAFKLGLNNTVTPPGASKENAGAAEHIAYEVNFAKGKNSDMYFLNDFKAVLNKPDTPPREQLFKPWITAKEAYNLLSGRSVNKDLRRDDQSEKVNVWAKIDLNVKDAKGNHPFRYFYPNYGYDLEKSLAKYPVKELADESKKEELINRLKKGDLAAGELQLQGKKTSIYIAANPEMKAVNLFDKKLLPIRDYHIWPELAKEKNEASGLWQDSASTQEVRVKQQSRSTENSSEHQADLKHEEGQQKKVGR
ncbi:hypothetical protein [Desertivirga xinjiangensis]|uniref:hypothetical protein n=1 Tax=Desertivirga xinjiangensis TaxID=539206 RepID=UPI0021098197|nr:hypothetical protein [Pedobacter xinjiangensis]